jgi:hypothetical protein
MSAATKWVSKTHNYGGGPDTCRLLRSGRRVDGAYGVTFSPVSTVQRPPNRDEKRRASSTLDIDCIGVRRQRHPLDRRCESSLKRPHRVHNRRTAGFAAGEKFVNERLPGAVAAGDRSFDADALVAVLRQEQAVWGLDVAVRELPLLADDAYERAFGSLASAVRPRLQLDALPAGLEELWRQ